MGGGTLSARWESLIGARPGQRQCTGRLATSAMAGPSDPILDLPDVVLRHLWPMLGESALLKCRMLSRRWRRRLNSLSVWSKYIRQQYMFGASQHPWKDYLYTKVRRTIWKRGMLLGYQMSIELTDKVSAGASYLYIGRGNTVIFFDNTLKEVQTVKFPGPVNKMYAYEDRLAVVTGAGPGYVVVVFDKLKAVHRLEATSNVLSLTAGCVCYIRENRMHVLSEGGEETDFPVPEGVVEIVSGDRSYTVLQQHPVYEGAGYSVYQKSHASDTWDKLVNRPNNNGIVYKFGTLLSNGKQLAIIDGALHFESYTYLVQVFEAGEPMSVLFDVGLMVNAGNHYFVTLMTKNYFFCMETETTLAIYGIKGGLLIQTIDVGRGVKQVLTHGDCPVVVYTDRFAYWEDGVKKYEINTPIQCSSVLLLKDSVIVRHKNTLMSYTMPRGRLTCTEYVVINKSVTSSTLERSIVQSPR